MAKTATAQVVLLTGAGGLVGTQLHRMLSERGHQVRTLSRRSGDYLWDVDRGELDPKALDGVDCIVHLAGEPIAQRWTDAAQERILNSRVDGTRLLAELAVKQASPPAMVMASGANYYGYHQTPPIDEQALPGAGFLARVCIDWEAAAQPLRASGGRVVMMRTGLVLSRHGGALAKLLTPFKLGLGGRIGSGEQRMSWVGLQDLCAMYCRAVEDSQLVGPVNAVAPEPVTNQRFTETLGAVLGRPTVFPLPASVVRALFGEMGQETLLADQVLSPEVLKQIGFQWKTPNLEKALRVALGQVDLAQEGSV